MKKALIVLSLAVALSASAQKKNRVVKSAKKVEKVATIKEGKSAKMDTQSIHQFKVTDLEGKEFDFAQLAGKKVIVVNTASKCGLTPQYKDLENLYKTFKDKNVVVVGFPANNFAEQEPGTNKEIGEFCQKNYGVTFPMMSKVSVKGSDIAPIYQFLTQKAKNGTTDSEVQWNFQKYLIDERGHVVKVISPKTPVTDGEVMKWVTQG